MATADLANSLSPQVLADLYSCILDFGLQALGDATKAGTYPLILKDVHKQATGMSSCA